MLDDYRTKLDKVKMAANCLPIFDSHCHIMGNTMLGKDLELPKQDERDDSDKRSNRRTATANRMRGPEWKNVDYIIARTNEFAQSFNRSHGVVLPMLIDMGYCPTIRKGITSASRRIIEGRSSFSDKFKNWASMSRVEKYYHKAYEREQKDKKKKKNKFEIYTWPNSDSDFDKQLKSHRLMACRYPYQVWPFIPFDPRREKSLDYVKANVVGTTLVDSNKPETDRIFVGVKLYTRTGWAPLFNNLLYGNEIGKELDIRLLEFYYEMSEKQIPIVVHTSPTGWPNEEELIYPDFMEDVTSYTENIPAIGNEIIQHQTEVATNINKTKTDLFYLLGEKWIKPNYSTWFLPSFPPPYPKDKRLFKTWEKAKRCYYMQLTVSPLAWENVLKIFPKLRICFAHFGGVQSLTDFAGDGTFRTKKVKNLQSLDPEILKLDKFKIEYEKLDRDRNLTDWFKGQHIENWTTKIVQLMKDYPNIYTDLSYFSSEKEMIRKGLPMIMKKLFDESPNCLNKILLGSDWHMTSGIAQGLAKDYLHNSKTFLTYMKKYCNKFEPQGKTSLSDDQVTEFLCENVLSFINLGADELDELEKSYGNAIKVELKDNSSPIFWDQLKLMKYNRAPTK